jgi:hypothetical protein
LEDSALRVAAAALVLGGGVIHLQQWDATYRHLLSTIPGVWVVQGGFLADFALSVVATAALIALGRKAWVLALTLAFQASAIVALLVSRRGSLFGWMEHGWSAGSRQIIGIAAAAVIVLAAALLNADTQIKMAEAGPDQSRAVRELGEVITRSTAPSSPPYARDDENLDRLADNLRRRQQSCRTAVDNVPGYDWWTKRLSPLINEVGAEAVANGVVCVELLMTASRSHYTRGLPRSACQRGRITTGDIAAQAGHPTGPARVYLRPTGLPIRPLGSPPRCDFYSPASGCCRHH